VVFEKELLFKDAGFLKKVRKGDADAWQLLYHIYQPGLVLALGRLLQVPSAESDLVQELAQRVWCALQKNNLQGFDPTKASFATFLAVLARRQLGLYRRDEARRTSDEDSPHAPEPADFHADVVQEKSWIEEFDAALTPRELAFFHKVLLGESTIAGELGLSDANMRTLKKQILKKWLGNRGILEYWRNMDRKRICLLTKSARGAQYIETVTNFGLALLLKAKHHDAESSDLDNRHLCLDLCSCHAQRGSCSRVIVEYYLRGR
jgi:DNA-directed RNA polymerase specialized sigma24 family protein